METEKISTILETTKPIRAIGIPWQEFGEGLVVLQTPKALIHEFNSTAAWIWQNCDGTKSIQELSEGLCQKFEISKDEAINDVREFVFEMSKMELLK